LDSAISVLKQAKNDQKTAQKQAKMIDFELFFNYSVYDFELETHSK